FHTGTRVILWNDPGGYDAYRVEPRFPDEMDPAARESYETKANYHSLRGNLTPEMREEVCAGGWTLGRLRECVDLFVLHYDACGTSRQCFKVLQDRRHLSVHFMLDLDGTIYQTLDLKERAWHAGTANDRSVGIEIANIGAYEDMETLDEWYACDEPGRPYVAFPEWLGETGIRTPGFVARPAREQVFMGEINGRMLYQYDLTEAQYDSLIKLTATLCQVLPRIEPDYPRDVDGDLRTRVLSEEEMQASSGLLGHWHVTTAKVDPGPAFDWDRLVERVRRVLDE
ncbi:MAG: N-acetylmuramoyl-L-alanine amidase, partial [Planctomycetes bacterium]|nr:N-acetylmuramoyl-L-alanine amidase [Planctomycetota bacterium]